MVRRKEENNVCVRNYGMIIIALHHDFKLYAFFQNMIFLLIFSKTIGDIGNMIAASDRPNETLQLSL